MSEWTCKELLAALVHRCEAEDCGTGWAILHEAKQCLLADAVTQSNARQDKYMREHQDD